MKTKYTLLFISDDMGHFTQPGVRDLDDALWHINNARDHDGLHPLTHAHLHSENTTLTPETALEDRFD